MPRGPSLFEYLAKPVLGSGVAQTCITEDDNEEYDAPTFLGLPDEGAGLQTTETRTFTDTYDNDSAGPTMGVPMTVLDQTSFTKVEGETYDYIDLEGMSIPDS